MSGAEERGGGGWDEGHDTQRERFELRVCFAVTATRLTDGLTMGSERLFNL